MYNDLPAMEAGISFIQRKNFMMINNMRIVKNVAIVSQDKRKNELIEWSFDNRHKLARHHVIALGETADVLEGTLNVPVQKLMPGNMGGYEELGRMIADGKVDMIMFIWDSNKTFPYESDIEKLQCLAEEQNLVVATTTRTGEAVLSSSFLNSFRLKNVVNEDRFGTKRAV